MFRRYLLIAGLLIATISAYGNTRYERRILPREDNPQGIVVEDNEEVCGDVADAHHIVVSKEHLTLKLYDKDNRLICRFPVSIGRHYGDKQELGDMKTPEGDFRIVQIQRASHWMYNNGKESIKNYYGNWFIRLNTEYSGIGIHGTHEPERIGERCTEGSIRLDNYHLDSLRAMIDVGIGVRIESSRLDREADGKHLIAETEVVAEVPIMNESATPVIEERHEVEQPAEEVVAESTSEESITAPSKVAETAQPQQKKIEKDVEWYTIKEGDFVGRVAARHGMTLAEIKRLNPDIDVDRVSIGQKIRVKGKPAEVSAPEPASTEQVESSDEVWHTVVNGDLVGRIAAQYGTTTRRIKELNPNLNPDRISIGQRIRVK